MNSCLLGTDWHTEELKYEINRVNRILRSPELPADERLIAEAQLQDYLEMLTAEELN